MINVATRALMTIAISTVVLFASACSTGGKRVSSIDTSVMSGQSKVIVYRPQKFIGVGIKAPFYLNGVELFKIANGTFAEISLKPGQHVLETRESGALESSAVGSLRIDMLPGQTRFIRWSPQSTGSAPHIVFFQGAFEESSEQQMRSEMKTFSRVYP